MQAQHQSSSLTNATTNNFRAGDSRTKEKFVVRLDDGMRDRIAQVASEQHRSMNSEIVIRLERSLEGESIQRDQQLLIQILSGRIQELEKRLGVQ
jgi:hypothetical protein